MAWTDSKYGYRGYGNAITVDLLRASYDPDPTPEFGNAVFKMSLVPHKFSGNAKLLGEAHKLNYPLSVVNMRPSKGALPLSDSFFNINGKVFVSGVKKHEDKNEIIIRLSETDGVKQEAIIAFKKKIKKAYLTDINEKADLGAVKIDGNSAVISLEPYAIATLAIEI